jgi:hypothetical protein
MAKYKIGDKVRVREDLVVGSWYGPKQRMCYNEEMDKHKGKILTVDAVRDGYYCMEETHYFGWTDEMLEDVVEDYSWLDALERIDYYGNRIDVPLKTDIAQGTSSSQRDMLFENKFKYCDAKFKKEEKQMKEFYIKNYKVCDNNGIKTLVVDFEDGTKERAVCCAEDEFELARGIEVCVMKHIFGRDNYKAMLKTAMRQVKAIDKAEEEAKKEKEMIAAKKASAARKKARYKANKRKKRITEMKEAYLAAMREYGTEACTICEASWEDIK